jgi:hypothetical protein
MVAPVLATDGTQLTISNNGSGADNEIKYDVSNTNTVNQTNEAKVLNTITSNSSTGGNKANKNNGGDVSIETGDSSSVVNVANVLNKNTAAVGCCDGSAPDVTIDGNAAGDEHSRYDGSDVDVDLDNKTEVQQNNNASVVNTVDSNTDTGSNKANKNNGGDVSISTGDAKSRVGLLTVANSNSATVGGGQDADPNASSIKIVNNGADSNNDVDVDADLSTKLWQTNGASVVNGVSANAYTGDNQANKNNGGDVSIDMTGDALSLVGVANTLNFNTATVDCCGLWGVDAKIANNGADSRNDIDFDLDSCVLITQDNDASVDNDIDANADTGSNKADKNNGGEVGIATGDADVLVGISNLLNFNSANVDCCLTDLSGLIDHNAADSHNDIDLDKDATDKTWQTNGAGVANLFDGNGNTGYNQVKSNNAGSQYVDPSVTTGDSTTEVSVDTQANVNEEGTPVSWSDNGFDVNLDFDWSAFLAHVFAFI